MEEELLLKALEESARMHGEENTKWSLTDDYNEGALLQIGVFNQFNQGFVKNMHQDVHAPHALCGFIASAMSLAFADVKLCNLEDIEKVREKMQNRDFVEPLVRESIKFIYDCRIRYTESHEDYFPGEKDGKNYLCNWVANYEISDFLRSKQKEGVVFIRFNQFPQISCATHEEKQRLLEEEKFGASEDELVLLAESFYPERKLQTISEAKNDGIKWKSAVIDCNGHFIFAKPFEDEKSEVKVIMFNTTSINYLKGAAQISAHAAMSINE